MLGTVFFCLSLETEKQSKCHQTRFIQLCRLNKNNLKISFLPSRSYKCHEAKIEQSIEFLKKKKRTKKENAVREIYYMTWWHPSITNPAYGALIRA